MDSVSKKALLSFFFQGGALLLLAGLLTAFLPSRFSAPAFLDALSYLVFAAGVLLAWRFRSGRVLLALLTLWLADRAVSAWISHPASAASARAVLDLLALLLPVNLVLFCLTGESGFSLDPLGYGFGILFAEIIAVGVLARPENAGVARWLEHRLLVTDLLSWSRVPQIALLVFAAAFALLATRFMLLRKPVEHAFMWAAAAGFLALEIGSGRAARIHFTAAGVVLIAGLIENSYRLAYHDELTGLPGRRALNEALLASGGHFVVAMVDVDHFKQFNDLFGHDAGDQVLRMVAARLHRVGGGGEAFRYGGEEFAILFSNSGATDALPHLEKMRLAIAHTRFMVRGPDRSRRRRRERRYSRLGRRPVGRNKATVGVTISIGVAESSASRSASDVILVADQALYAAKNAGRNRIEVAGRRTEAQPATSGA